MKNMCGTTPEVAILAIDQPHWYRPHRNPRRDFECLPETLLRTDLWDSTFVYIYLQIKDGERF